MPLNEIIGFFILPLLETKSVISKYPLIDKFFLSLIDYASVGIPMLPSVKGSAFTVNAISKYGLATVVMSIFGIFALPEGGLLYEIMVIPFNARLLQLISRLKNSPDDLILAKGLFRWSILYMFGICLLLLLARTNLSVEFEEQTLKIASSIFSQLYYLINF